MTGHHTLLIPPTDDSLTLEMHLHLPLPSSPVADCCYLAFSPEGPSVSPSLSPLKSVNTNFSSPVGDLYFSQHGTAPSNHSLLSGPPFFFVSFLVRRPSRPHIWHADGKGKPTFASLTASKNTLQGLARLGLSLSPVPWFEGGGWETFDRTSK